MQGFLNENVVKIKENKRKKQMIWGIALIVLFGSCGIEGLCGNEKLKDGVVLYFTFTALGIWLLICAFKTYMELQRAKFYNSVFCCDADGFLSIGELENHTGKNAVVIFREIEMLIKKDYFIGCDMQYESNAGVRLLHSDEIMNLKGFTVVKCASCGGVNRIKIGVTGTCKFCAGPIKSE